MKILMLCLEFPPVNTTGNFRSAGFARHFSNQGHEVVVLTCDPESGEATFNRNPDYQLLKGLEKVNIYRFPIAPLKKFWTKGIPNKFRIWWNSTDKIDQRWYIGKNREKIDAIIRKEAPDVLYVSLPPFSVARIAITLSQKFKIPLITDMRDAWSLWVNSPFSTRIHYFIIKKLEKKLFKNSSMIIGVTPEVSKDFRSQHPEIPVERFKTIYNGYDDLDLKLKSVLPDTDRGKYRIGYIGNFYYDPISEKTKETQWYKRKGLKKLYFSPRQEKWIYRSPYFFLKTLSQLFLSEPSLRSRMQFELVGNEPLWLNEMIEKLNLQENIINHGFKSKSETLAIQSGWDSILATSEKVENGQHFCLPSKIFDGIVSGKPILAFITAGAQYNFLQEFPQVVFFDPDALNENVEILKSVAVTNPRTFKTKKLSEKYTREYQSEKLLCLMSQVGV